MALTDFDEYIALLSDNRAADFQATSVGRPNFLSGTFRNLLPAPVTRTTSEALDKTSDLSIGPIPNVGSGRLSIMGARVNPGGNSGVAFILIDLLNISGGLTPTVTTEQTTNLPTAALTRHTTGEGVMAGLILYTAVGATITTFTVSYTNQAGTAGRISTATRIGGSNYNGPSQLLPIPLQGADTGIRSIESVTLSAEVGGSGNFGVAMWKPLAMMALNDQQGAHVVDAVSTGGFIGALAEVHPDACLSMVSVAGVTQALTGAVLLAEV